MSTRTVNRAAIYGDLFIDSALDDADLDTETAVFTAAWREADAAIGRAAREELRSRRIKASFEDRNRFRAEVTA